MPDSTPPAGFSRIWLALIALALGGLAGVAFHDLAGLRPFLPPILTAGRTLACQDLDAYVEHVADLSDHHIHVVTFGIHRQKTVDAVNELYDRARCQPKRDASGHETYQTIKTMIEADVFVPPPPAPIATAAAPTPAPLELHSKPIGRAYSRRRTVVVRDDEPATTPVEKTPPCGPDPVSGVNWHRAGCPQ